ncbi:unnamed protein product [marine sediment metagenome]|uniref:Uncharacterized protein n=1 Tax=marine sediment metagenome TaxID=412755 RepID=X1RI93_9ZZZZ
MAFRKRTLRTMSPTARKVARLAGDAESVARRLKNLVPDLQRLDADSQALATAKQNSPVWLNPQVLTEALTDELTDNSIEASTENLTKLWEDFVATELHEGLCKTVVSGVRSQLSQRSEV